MDLHWGCTVYLIVLIAYIPLLSLGQEIRCSEPCPIGFTCAMVRNASESRIAPGCINMQEAILLARALEGGPTGPGTGISSQSSQSSPSGSTHSHSTSGGIITHTHEIPSQTQTQPRPPDPNVFQPGSPGSPGMGMSPVRTGMPTSGQITPMPPMFPRQLADVGPPGMGFWPPRWMRPGGFVPMSPFQTGTSFGPFGQPIRQFGPSFPQGRMGMQGQGFQTQRTFQGGISGESQFPGATFQGGFGGSSPNFGQQLEQPIFREPRVQITGVTFSGAPGGIGSDFRQQMGQPLPPARGPVNQMGPGMIRQQPQPQPPIRPRQPQFTGPASSCNFVACDQSNECSDSNHYCYFNPDCARRVCQPL